MNFIAYKEDEKEDEKIKNIFEEIQKQEEYEKKTRIFYAFQKSFCFINAEGNKILYTYGLDTCFTIFIVYKNFFLCSHIDNNNLISIIFLLDILEYLKKEVEIFFVFKEENKNYINSYKYLLKLGFINIKRIQFNCDKTNIIFLSQYENKKEIYIISDNITMNSFFIKIYFYKPLENYCDDYFKNDILSNFCVNMLTRGIIGISQIEIKDILEYINEKFEKDIQKEKLIMYLERIKISLSKILKKEINLKINLKSDLSIDNFIDLFCKDKDIDELTREIYLNSISIFFYDELN
jgi:hypothetical protein